MIKDPEVLKAIGQKLANPVWRLSNLYAIEDKWGKLSQFKPNKAQIAFFANMHVGGNAILKARQMGMSTGIVMWTLDQMLFKDNTSAGIVDKTLVDAEAKIKKIRVAYDNLDSPHMPMRMLGSLLKQRVTMTTSSSQRIEFSNGSGIQAGRSLRGGTVQILHISELGKIAIEEPKKAAEIKSGALNTIAPGNYVFVESTHEGGRIGMHYQLMKAAMENDPERLSPVDMKFHFFPWNYDPTYEIDPSLVDLRPEMVEYFDSLDVELTDAQKAWYDRKEREQGEAMKKEYPTTPDEAFETSNAGAIYAKYIATARAEGRILDFEYEPNEPVVCSWDLGVSDYTSIWAVQFVGREIHWLDFYEASGEPVSHFAGVMREWDRKYNNISMHYLPHDAGYRDKNAMTYVQHLSTCGINNVTVVPRTPDIWLGVNNLRDMLKRSLLHKTNCGTPRVDSVGTEHPSGIDCLEGYRTKGVDAAGMVSEMPLHDETSHACDAARTLAEAFSRGMVGKDGSTPGLRREGGFRPRVITGAGGVSSVANNRRRAIR